MKWKVGDRVRVKLDLYKHDKMGYGVNKRMGDFSGEVVTIEHSDAYGGIGLKEVGYHWHEDMFETIQPDIDFTIGLEIEEG